MGLDTLRKPSTKPSSSKEKEERREQLSGNTPTTKSPDTSVPLYLRTRPGASPSTEHETQEDPRSGIPRYLWGELDRAAAPAPQPASAPTPTAPAMAAPAGLGKSEPLTPEAAARFSRAYGHDLSGVRVHPDSPLPGALGARAFTIGNDIAFARDAYQPGSSNGQRLLAHELAHVVQQSRGQQGIQGEGLSTDGYERQADDAAQAAMSGQPVAELSPLSTPTLQRKAADAPPPSAPAAREKPRPGKVPPGVVDLSKGQLDTANLAPDAHGRVLARLPGLAEGELELEKRGEGYSTRGEGYALPLTVGPLAGVLGNSLVLVVRIDNNVISGHASVGKPGRAVPRGDAALFRAIEKSPEALGWTGLSKLSVGTPRNALQDGSLKLGADSARFTLGGFVEGTASFSVADERVTFSGSADVKLPGASAGRLEVGYSPETGLSGEVNLKVGVGKVSGGVDARLRQGALDIQGTAGYAGDQLKGSVTLVATDADTAREITRMPPQAGVLPGQQGAGATAAGAGSGAAPTPAAAKPGPRALCGWGELDFSFTEWLTGRARVVINSQGEATVQGEIAPPKEIILFEQKEVTKSLVKLEARAPYGLPVVGNVFVFANVGLEALASIGPGKLYNIQLSGQYSTDKAADKELSLQASLNIPAYAGLRLRAEGGAGVELVDHDIKFGVGVWALAGVRGYVEATPTIGYRQKAGASGEFYFKGHMELAAQPFLGLGGDLFVEVDSPFWSPLPDEKWTWPLGSLEYPLPGEFGLGADVEHVLGSKQWPELQFTEVEFDSSRFMMDLLSGGAPGRSKGGEEQKPGKWKEDAGGGAPAGGKNTAGGGGAPTAGGPKTSGKAASGPRSEGKGAPGRTNKPGDKTPKKKDDKAPPKSGASPKKQGKDPKKEEKGATSGQFGEAVQFAAAGESYSLWIQVRGKNATLMLAQPAQSAGAWLGQQEKKLASLEPAQDSKVKPLVSQARQLVSIIDKEADQIAASGAGGKAQAQQANEKLKKDQHRLSGVLRQLLVLAGPKGSLAVLSLPVSMAGVTHTLFVKLGASPVVEMASKRDLLSNKIGRAVGRLIRRRKDLETSGQDKKTLDELKGQITDLQEIGSKAKGVQEEAARLHVHPGKDLSGFDADKEVPGFKVLRGEITAYSELYGEKDIEGYLEESVSEPEIYKLLGKQLVKRGSGDKDDEKLVEDPKGYSLKKLKRRIYISRKDTSNKYTPDVHLDEAGVLRSGGKSQEKEADTRKILADYREMAANLSKIARLKDALPKEPEWSDPPTPSELKQYREELRTAVVAKYKGVPLSMFDKEVLSSAVIPATYNKIRGVMFELWVIQNVPGVLGHPKPFFVPTEELRLSKDIRLSDGWMVGNNHIKLVDTKAIQVEQLKDGTPTASPPSEEQRAQAADYERITAAALPWTGVTADGTVVTLPCKMVVYIFNHQIVANIWYPRLLRIIHPSRLETLPRALPGPGGPPK